MPRHIQLNVATIPADHPGRPANHSGTGCRMSSTSAARHSRSINSACANRVVPVTGDRACRHGRPSGRTVARATHRHVTTTPPTYQSVTPPAACSACRRSASAHTAPNSARDTRRFSPGTRSTSDGVTSTLRG